MASTDIDGSPILILSRLHAELMVAWAQSWQQYIGPFTDDQRALLRRIAETFPDLDVPDYS